MQHWVDTGMFKPTLMIRQPHEQAFTQLGSRGPNCFTSPLLLPISSPTPVPSGLMGWACAKCTFANAAQANR